MKIEGEKIYDNIEAKEEKQELEIAERQELEAQEQDKDQHYQLKMVRMKISMEEKVAKEKLGTEKVKLDTEEKVTTKKEKEKLTEKLPKFELKRFDGNVLN